MKQLLLIILFSTAIFGQSGKSVLTQAQKDSIGAMISDSLSSNINYFYYDAEKYGVVGDNATNCTDDFKTLLNTVETNGGGIIYFPEGTILLDAWTTDTLTVPIRMVGQPNTILKGDSTTNFLYVKNSLKVEGLEFYGWKHVFYTNLVSHPTLGVPNSFIEFYNCKFINVAHAINGLAPAVTGWETNENNIKRFIVDNCYFRNNQYGIGINDYAYISEIRISNNTIDSLSTNPATIYAGIAINGVQFYHQIGLWIGQDAETDSMRNYGTIKIYDNIFSNIHQADDDLLNAASYAFLLYRGNTEIYGNTFKNITNANSLGSTTAGQIRDNRPFFVHDNTFINCVSTNTGASLISKAGSDYITISNNFFLQDSSWLKTYPLGNKAIYIESGDKHIVKGNTFYNYANAILFAGTYNGIDASIDIENNTLYKSGLASLSTIGETKIIGNVGYDGGLLNITEGTGQTTHGKSIIIKNNSFTYLDAAPAFAIQAIPHFLEVSNNSFISVNGTTPTAPTSQVDIGIGTYSDTTATVMVKNNIFKASYLTYSFYTYGIYLRKPVGSLFIENNDFIGHQRCLWIPQTIDTLIIKNNNFSKSPFYSASEYINWATIEDFIEVSNNTGYMNTFSTGVDSINSGDTTVTINHELSNVENPQRVIQISTSDLGSSTRAIISNIGATSFHVDLDADPTQTVYIYWTARSKW